MEFSLADDPKDHKKVMKEMERANELMKETIDHLNL